jgi:prepilin-type N-terminal cleavage/methylation domain-containing protein
MSTRRCGSPLLAKRGRGQHGFTLVELMITLTVLGVGVLGVTRVFLSAMKVTAQGNDRSRAVAVATREIESMQAIPYDQLGFSPLQPGFLGSFEGAVTVDTANPLVEPAGTIEVGGRRFGIERRIVWANAAGTGGSAGTIYSHAYKRVTVMVSWSDESANRLVREDGLIYPAGRGRYAGPGGSTTTTAPSSYPPGAPLDLTTAVPEGSSGASTVNLAWRAPDWSDPPVATWVVQYSTDDFVTTNQLTDSQPASIRTFTVTGLSPASTYKFRVAAKAVSGAVSNWSNTAVATTTAAAAPGCRLGTASLTPNAVKRRDNASTVLADDPVASVNTSGSCGTLRLSYRPTTATTTTVVLVPTGGGVLTGTVDGKRTSWDTGTHTIDIVDSANAVLGTFTLTVCVHNARTCP